MMFIQRFIFVFVFFFLGVVGCESCIDKSQIGGVEILVSDFDGLFFFGDVNVNFQQIELLILQSIVKDVFVLMIDVMNVEFCFYEVIYLCVDEGIWILLIMVCGIFGVVFVNGMMIFENFFVFDLEVLRVELFLDLFFQNGGIDFEMGNFFVCLNYFFVFFGCIILGDEVCFGLVNFMIEVCFGFFCVIF